MRKIILFAICLLSVAAFAAVLFNSRLAQQNVAAQETDAKNSSVNKQIETISGKGDEKLRNFNELIERAQNSGSVRVIVGLQTAFTPEGELSSIGKNLQRAEIKQTQNNLVNRLKNFQVTEIKQFKFIPYAAFAVDAATLEQMKNAPEIVSIYEDRLFEPTLAESTAVIGAPGGISNGFSGSGQTVAVLDTGVDKNHVFFSGGKVVSEACYSTTNAVYNSTSVCPGGAQSSTAPDSGLNCPDTTVGCYHGTHVAGIVGGKDTAGNRFGVAKDAGIIAVQIFSSFAPSRCGAMATSPCALSYTSDILRGLERVYELSGTFNIAAVNMSLGGDTYAVNCDNDSEYGVLKTAIDNLRSVNTATIIASGNNYSTSSVSAPGCISTAISVGSTTDGTSGGAVDTVSAFSNSADFMNLLAPGQTINSSMPGANNFSSLSGTSMAAPHVAGAWAILKQQNPAATVSQILTALTSTGKIVTDTRSGAGNRKKPRIRVDAALRQLAGTDCVRTSATINQLINSSLNAGDCALESGVNRDLYSFTTTAADSKVTLLMSSADFDAYLYLLDPNGKIIAFDDNSGGGTAARIPASGSLTLPVAGNYTIIATKPETALRGDAPQNGNYALNVLAPSPTASAAAVSGQVFLPVEIGLTNALVTLTDLHGNSRTVLTGKSGKYRFGNVAVGETYIISVLSRRYTYAPQIITVTEDLTGINFTALF